MCHHVLTQVLLLEIIENRAKSEISHLKLLIICGENLLNHCLPKTFICSHGLVCRLRLFANVLIMTGTIFSSVSIKYKTFKSEENIFIMCWSVKLNIAEYEISSSLITNQLALWENFQPPFCIWKRYNHNKWKPSNLLFQIQHMTCWLNLGKGFQQLWQQICSTH